METKEQKQEDHDNVPETGTDAVNSMRQMSVAHETAALTPCQLQGPKKQQTQPPARAVAPHLPAKASQSLTAHQAPHPLQDGPVHHVLKRL